MYFYSLVGYLVAGVFNGSCRRSFVLAKIRSCLVIIATMTIACRVAEINLSRDFDAFPRDFLLIFRSLPPNSLTQERITSNAIKGRYAIINSIGSTNFRANDRAREGWTLPTRTFQSVLALLLRIRGSCKADDSFYSVSCRFLVSHPREIWSVSWQSKEDKSPHGIHLNDSKRARLPNPKASGAGAIDYFRLNKGRKDLVRVHDRRWSYIASRQSSANLEQRRSDSSQSGVVSSRESKE